MPESIKEMAEEYEEKTVKEISIPTNENELKSILINKGIEKRKELEGEPDKNGKVKKPRLSTLQTAEIMNDVFCFCRYDKKEHTRLAIYLPFEGIYTQNAATIKRYIFYVESVFTERQAEDVIYKIFNMTDPREKTNERHLIPVENGVFNLKTKKLEEFSPKYVFTTKIATKYKDSPKPISYKGWNVDDWLRSIACNDEEIVTLLWQVINESLNGNYTRKKAIFLVGRGNNGKGTFQQLVINLVGRENVATLKVNEFDMRFMISELEGKTVCIGDDVPAGVYIDDSSKFNSVATGDIVSVERKNKDPYGAVFRTGIIQSTNEMPKFRNKTDGTTRRILIAPFNANFNGSIENFKIKEEYIGTKEVLEYVLHKAINLDFEKFIEPKVSKEALKDFEQDNNPIADFKASVFDMWSVTRVPKYVVYGFYKDFCNENGYKHVTLRKFTKEFESLLTNDWEEKDARIDPKKMREGVGSLPYNLDEPIPSKVYKSYLNITLKVV